MHVRNVWDLTGCDYSRMYFWKHMEQSISDPCVKQGEGSENAVVTGEQRERERERETGNVSIENCWCRSHFFASCASRETRVCVCLLINAVNTERFLLAFFHGKIMPEIVGAPNGRTPAASSIPSLSLSLSVSEKRRGQQLFNPQLLLTHS